MSFKKVPSKKDSSQKIPYYVGLDIGTSSVGWSITDSDCNLMQYKGKLTWGSRLFSEGQTAAARRLKRGARRRYVRRRNRIELLQQLTAKTMAEFDEDFFHKMSESFYIERDKTLDSYFDALDSIKINGEKLRKKFPTAYHLRAYLMQSTEKEDFRLVYLALHHAMKYRGNFLYEGQSFDVSRGLEDALDELFEALRERGTMSEEAYEAKREIISLFEGQHVRKKDEELKELFGDKALSAEILKALVGNQTKVDVILGLIDVEDASVYKIKLSDEEKVEALGNLLADEDTFVFDMLKRAYSAMQLHEILGNEKSISRAMINRYQQYGKDLKEYKDLVRALCPERYNEIFRNESGKILGIVEAFKTVDAAKENEEYLKLEERAKRDAFMVKPRSRENGAIPNQLHVMEAEKIINNQAKYYSELAENKDKILATLQFRIPYYVGPLSKGPHGDSKFAWATRKVEGEKIYPWNWKEIIDVDASAEEFIERMKGNCTYIPSEKVVPKCSLLYSEYELLNEINKVRINGKLLDVETRDAIIEELFKGQKKVTHKKLQQWLKDQQYPSNSGTYEIRGTQKENEFACGLGSYVDFQRIFGEITIKNEKMIEDIILWLTLFTEQDIIKRKISQNYPEITDEQIKKILRVKCAGWGRFCRKFLMGIKSKDGEFGQSTIMEILRSTTYNLMEIINDKKFGFEDVLKEINQSDGSVVLSYDLVEELYCSPAVRKGIWQALKIVEEIIDIFGYEPSGIAIEMAREEGEKKRIDSRKKKLDDLYSKLKKNPDFVALAKQLNNYEERDLRNDRLFLYFTQRGKCMYSGEPLDINNLSAYQIDHIIPQSYIKDDSLDNRVLVKSRENQYKGNQMLLSTETVRRMYSMWEQLSKVGLISQKKFSNLTRTEVSEDRLKGFVKRQLVETRQINKVVLGILGELYPDTRLYGVRAEMLTALRQQYQWPKIRELNDAHHAFDAYLATSFARFVQKRFPCFEDSISYDSYMKYVRKGEVEGEQRVTRNSEEQKVKSRQSFFIRMFGGRLVDTETGELIWDGEHLVKELSERIDDKRVCFSKKAEEDTGAFYGETIYAKDSVKATIPLKEGQNVKDYGGYNSEAKAYMLIIEFTKGKKRQRKLISLPIRVVNLEKTKPGAVAKYLEESYQDVKILRDHIGKGQEICYQGQHFYLASDSELNNAQQMFLERNKMARLDRLLVSTNEYPEFNADALMLFEVLAKNLARYYRSEKFSALGNKIVGKKEEFQTIDWRKKKQCIEQLLIASKADSVICNFSKILSGFTATEGRKNSFAPRKGELQLIEKSITGLNHTSWEF